MTEEQKMELYNINLTSVSKIVKRGSLIYQLYDTIVNGMKNTSKYGGKNALKYFFLKQIPCRFFVQLGILDKPESLGEDKLIKDAEKDAKNFNIYLGICEAICACIPDAQAAVPFIEKAKHYTKWYRDHGVEVVRQRINDEKESKIKQLTNEKLAETIKKEERKAV